MKSEAQKRQEFYELIHEDIKAEFINGEIIFHSPVARKHWLINSRVSFQLMTYIDFRSILHKISDGLLCAMIYQNHRKSSQI
ncbi:MAG: hypothetical protein HC917_23025 [Richelia sp. SM2_1_7]|nr:hypothetical protein [Richelia sp. SM2_1_7]